MRTELLGVFALCNELGFKKAWKKLFNELPGCEFEIQVVIEDERQNNINKILV